MPLDEYHQRFTSLLYGWHDYQLEYGPFKKMGIIDFDFHPRRDAGVTRITGNADALQQFTRLLRDIPIGSEYAELSIRTRICQTVLTHAQSPKMNLDRLIINTLGYRAPVYSDAKLAAAHDAAAEAFAVACNGAFRYDSQGVAEAYRAAPPPRPMSANEFRTRILDVLAKPFGVPSTKDIDITSASLAEESAGWAGTNARGIIGLVINSVSDPGDNPGIPNETRWHEGSHGIVAQGWRNAAGENMSPVAERTVLFGPEQVSLEGIGETIAWWNGDFAAGLSAWDNFRVQSKYTSNLAWGNAFRMAAEGDVEGGLAYIDRWVPDATMPDIRRSQMNACLQNPILLCNRFTYIIGTSIHRDLAESMNPQQRQAFLQEAATAPMTPARLMAHTRSHGINESVGISTLA